MQGISEKKRRGTDLCFIAAMALVCCVYLARLRLGVAGVDECLYLATPFRLLQGDALLVDEWHMSQLHSVIIAPILKLALIFTGGSTEGIYLIFRYIYLACQLATACIGYLFLRKRHGLAAVFASAVYALSTPFMITALSYNSLGLMTVYLFAVSGTRETSRPRLQHALRGVLLAMSVLCNPYMLLLYALLFAAALFSVVRKKPCFGVTVRSFAWITAGAAAVLAVFLAFVLSRASVAELIENIPWILTDPEHPGRTAADFFRPAWTFLRSWYVFVILLAVPYLTGLFVRKLRGLCFAALSVVTAAFIGALLLRQLSELSCNSVMLPMTLLGAMACTYTEKKNPGLLTGFAIGAVYIVCMNLSSNTGLLVIYNACTVTTALAVLMIFDYLREFSAGRRTAALLIAVCLLGAQLPGELGMNAINFFNESARFWQLTEKVESGPMKGLFLSERMKQLYDENGENIRRIEEHLPDGTTVLFFQRLPYGYLMLDNCTNASYSAWIAELFPDFSGDGKMAEYYRLHPERMPDLIYIDSLKSTQYAAADWQALADELGYEMHAFPDNGILIYAESAG